MNVHDLPGNWLNDKGESIKCWIVYLRVRLLEDCHKLHTRWLQQRLCRLSRATNANCDSTTRGVSVSGSGRQWLLLTPVVATGHFPTSAWTLVVAGTFISII